jgi:protein kinase-like protein
VTGTLAAGARLGRYRIVRLLGSGAMGDVYLAEDPQIERQLAIKTVRVAEGKPEDVEDRKRRLLREAKAAGKMIHPHVVTLFDAGEAEGVLYLAFEFVGGSDLATRMESDPPLTLGEVLRIVREAADALDFAHRQGIVHRDIKPANIMLDTNGRVKVADFGIAKVVGQATELTMTGSVVGSPHYLSPEQVRGEDLDGRTDVFSLGVVLYELLGHRRPFQGESLTTLVYQILHQEPPPIPQLRADLAPYLDSLLRRMMAKDRDQRFPNAAAVASEIAGLERDLGPERLAQPVGDVDVASQGTTLMPSTASGTPRGPSVATAQTLQAAPPVPSARPATGAVAPPVAAAPLPLVAASAPPAKRSPLPIILAVLAVLFIGGGIGLYLVLGKLLFKPKPPQVGKTEPVAVTQQVEPARPTPPNVQTPSTQTPSTQTPPKPEPVVQSEPVKPAPVTQEPPKPAPSAPEPPPATPAKPQQAAQTPPKPAPAPPAQHPAAPEPPPAEPEPEPVPELSFDKEISTGTSIAFNIVPDNALIRFKPVDERRWTVLGQAKEWSGKKDMRTWQPEAGDYLVGILAADRTVTYLVHVKQGGPALPIALNLGPPKKR